MRNDSNHEQEWRDWIKLTKRGESDLSMTHEELLLYLYKQEKEDNRRLRLRLLEAYATLGHSEVSDAEV